jgi:hypothetical protein
MIEALLGGGLGAIARMAPEVLKFFDRKNERTHELALGDQQARLIELGNRGKLEQAQIEAQSHDLVAALEALRAGIAGQSTLTGVKWVDALSSSVRPVITYLFTGAYLYYKMITGTWEPQDTAIFSGILNFWFMGRVFETVARTKGAG